MPDALLVAACRAFFSERASVAMKLKEILSELQGSSDAEQSGLRKLYSAVNLKKGDSKVVSAEANAAVDLLRDCLISSTGAGNERHLAQAEEICLRIVQRPSADPADALLHARARFILAAINHIRSEPEVCAASVAHCFAKAPRWSRNTMASVFEATFRPSCADAYAKLEKAEAEANANSFGRQIAAKRFGAVAVGAGIACASVAVGMWARSSAASSHMLRQGTREIVAPMWKSATRDHALEAQLAEVRQRFEAEIDRLCQAAALRFL